jgi:hypothetical protein
LNSRRLKEAFSLFFFLFLFFKFEEKNRKENKKENPSYDLDLVGTRTKCEMTCGILQRMADDIFIS